MKFVSFIAMLFAAFALSAAETAIWDGTQASVKTGNKATTATAADGVLTISGKSSDTARYSYQDCRIAVAPTVVKGKKLSVTIEPATVITSDTFYIKGIAAGNKVVFSYGLSLKKAEKQTYTLNLVEENDPFILHKHQINAEADAPITALHIFMGRREKSSDMKLTVSDIKLID